MNNHLITALNSNRALKRLDTSFSYLRIRSVYIHTAAKRIIFFMLVGQLVSLSIQAQTSHSRKKEDFDVNEFDEKVIDITSDKYILQLNNMQGITVVDARADTSVIGFMQKKIAVPFFDGNASMKNQTEQRINRTPTFITLNSGLQKEVTQFMQRAIVFPGDKTMPGILMVIKKLWLSDELNIINQEQTRGRLESSASKDVWTSGIDVKIEFYLNDKGNYYALYRYDSVISKPMTVSEYGSEFVQLALQLSVEKLQQLDKRIAGITAKKRFSIEEINNHNENDFSLPVLKDSILNSGVYITFDEFKNNNPSQQHFEIKKDKLADILYIIQQDGKEWVARDVWGYCNGKNAYVKTGDNFFLLQRIENAFYIFGAKNLKWIEGQSYPVSPAYSGNNSMYSMVYYKNAKWELQLKPFQLDWSSGNLY